MRQCESTQIQKEMVVVPYTGTRILTMSLSDPTRTC